MEKTEGFLVIVSGSTYMAGFLVLSASRGPQYWSAHHLVQFLNGQQMEEEEEGGESQ